MTDPSPAQKAVAAFNERYELCGPFEDDWAEQTLAAALEAVADQVVPEEEVPVNARGTRHWHRVIQRAETRAAFLAIAAELRGDTTTSNIY